MAAYQYILGGAIASVLAAYFMFIKLRTEKSKASLKKLEDGESLAYRESQVEEDGNGSSDVIIVGAGVAGAALAYSLAKDGRKVHVIERNLSEPNRISGELLHPGGYLKLVELGLEESLNGIDGQELHGFVSYRDGKYVKLPFAFTKLKSDVKGRTFHNGRFVQRMRDICASLPNIKMEEGTVTSLVKENGIVKGARYKTQTGEEKIAHASLTVVCDGCFSNLRKVLCNPQIYQASHLVGWVVKKREVEHPNQAYVIFADPSPILFYPISSTEYRCFVIMPTQELPSISNGEFAHFLRTVVAPQVPPELSSIFTSEIDKRSMRTMPNCRMPASPYFIPGAILLGDALNMRHPHTAGGMTVALNDVVILRDLLRHYSHHLKDVDALCHHLQSFYSLRKPMAVTIDTWSALTDTMICSPPTLAMKEIHQLQIDFLNIRFAGISPAEVAIAMISGINPSIPSMLLFFFCSGMYIAARSLVEFRTPSSLWKRARSFWVLGRLVVATVWTNGIRKGSTERTV